MTKQNRNAIKERKTASLTKCEPIKGRNAEKVLTTSFREKGSFSCRHICLGKQLLPKINICCREVMQNNKDDFMGQPLMDACSILEKRLSGSRVGFEF